MQAHDFQEGVDILFRCAHRDFGHDARGSTLNVVKGHFPYGLRVLVDHIADGKQVVMRQHLSLFRPYALDVLEWRIWS